MRRALPLLVLVLTACPPPSGTVEDEDALLELTFDPSPAASARLRYDRLELLPDRVSLVASGPSGPASVVLLSDGILAPLSAEEPLTLHLPAGAYEDAVVGIELGQAGHPALVAFGVLFEDDDDDDADGRPFQLEVELLDVEFQAGSVLLGEATWRGVVDLAPLTWLDGIPPGDPSLPLVVGPGSGAAYDRLVDNVRAALDLRVPP
jgi:hypothetical protein